MQFYWLQASAFVSNATSTLVATSVRTIACQLQHQHVSESTHIPASSSEAITKTLTGETTSNPSYEAIKTSTGETTSTTSKTITKAPTGPTTTSPSSKTIVISATGQVTSIPNPATSNATTESLTSKIAPIAAPTATTSSCNQTPTSPMTPAPLPKGIYST